jgi:sugar phosphate isomerase/epimerase
MDTRSFLKFAAELGLSLVQIADNLPLNSGDFSDMQAVRRDGMQLELGARGIGHDHIRRYIDACVAVSARLLRVVIDSAGDEPSLDEAASRIAAFVPDLRAAGVTLAIENHDRFQAAEFASLVKSIASPHVRICLDTANSFGALEGPDVVFEHLLPWTANLHLKDFTVHRFPNMMGFEIVGTVAGEGRLDCAALIQRLYSVCPDANVVLELWPPADSNLASTLHKEELWARRSVHNLRSLFATPKTESPSQQEGGRIQLS